MARKHGRTLLRSGAEHRGADQPRSSTTEPGAGPQITRHGVLMNINGQGVLLWRVRHRQKRNSHRAAEKARSPSGGRTTPWRSGGYPTSCTARPRS